MNPTYFYPTSVNKREEIMW